MRKLYASTTPLHTKELNVNFGILGGPGTNSLWILRDDCVIQSLQVIANVDKWHLAFQYKLLMVKIKK